MSEVETVIAALVKRGADFCGPAPAELIRAAEDLLGVSFRGSYREFLQVAGAGDVEGVELLGLNPESENPLDAALLPSCVRRTIDARHDEGVPVDSVVICTEPDGDYFLLQCDTCGDSSPVRRWNHHLGFASDEQFEDFIDFLEYITT